MDKQQKKILFWVLTWAGLLLAVLYSPLGSPDLYSSRQFYIANKSVNFNGEAITYANRMDNTNKIEIKNNFTKHSNYSTNNTAEIDVINNQESKSKQIGREGAIYSSNTGANHIQNPISAQTSSQESNYNNTQNAGGSSGIGNDFYAYSSGRKSNKSNNNVMSESDISALSTNLNIPSITGNITLKQSGTSGLNDTTDPGGDPFGKPIPVGEGWIYMLVLVTAYGLWKFKIGKN